MYFCSWIISKGTKQIRVGWIYFKETQSWAFLYIDSQEGNNFLDVLKIVPKWFVFVLLEKSWTKLWKL